MSPPLAFDGWHAAVFWVAFAAVMLPEVGRLVRRRSGDGATSHDAGSRRVLAGCLAGGNALAFVLAVNGLGPTVPAPRVAFWAGVALMVAGAAFRGYAVRTLGRFFTTDVAVADDHAVVERGPYRWVRHPSYAGGFAAMAGVGLALANAAGLLALLVLPAVGYVHRVRVEERVLRAELGDRYAAYAARTPYRLVPRVW